MSDTPPLTMGRTMTQAQDEADTAVFADGIGSNVPEVQAWIERAERWYVEAGALAATVAALTADKERLDWLESMGCLRGEPWFRGRMTHPDDNLSLRRAIDLTIADVPWCATFPTPVPGASQ